MAKLWKKKMVPALLVGTMVLSYGAAVSAEEVKTTSSQKAPAITFKDIKNHWAEKTIQEMAELKVINGYSDSTFRPNESVTQLQAVTMVMNVLKQKSVDLVTSGSDPIVDVPAWAKESVQLALYNDIISAEEMKNFNKPATRMFVVNLLVNGLGEDLDNKVTLPFTDIASLSTEQKTNLAVALQNSLVEGYSNNTFRPTREVTRAEMAAFSSRLFDKIEVKDIDFNEGYERFEMVKGTISRIAADVKELTIGSETFGTDDSAVIKINDKTVRFNDLTIGLQVDVVLKNKKIVEINAYSKEENEKVIEKQILSGPISSLDLTNKRLTVGLKTIAFADQVKIEVNGELANSSYLKNGMEAVLVVTNNKIESIYAFDLSKQKDEAVEDVKFKVREDNEDEIVEARFIGDRVSDTTPDLDDGRFTIRLNGGSSKRIDLEEIDGSQRDGKEVAKELEKAIEDAFDDERVRVTYDDNNKRFIFQTYDSPTNRAPSIEFDGDKAVLDALGLDDVVIKGSLREGDPLWRIIVESDAKKDQSFEIEVIVDDEDIDETIKFSVKKGDKAEKIADKIADALIQNYDIRDAFTIKVDDEEVILVPDDEDWDIEIDINKR